MKNMSDKQKKVLDFIESQINSNGYPPSVREICSAMNFKSSSTAHSYLKLLEERGMISRAATKNRAIRLINTNISNVRYPDFGFSGSIVNVPVVGRVAAGQPILAQENITDTFPVSSDKVRGSTVFMLNIKGDSMIEAGILNSDLILVRQQSTAENGDIVVALIGDEATVKRFYKEKDHIRLQPENHNYDPIIVNSDVSILGKVIGLYRNI